MRTFLRVKIKSLAAEAAIIRREELRLKGGRRRTVSTDEDGKLKPRVRIGGQIPWLRAHQAETDDVANLELTLLSLHHHRTIEVRREARAAHLAYGYLRGRPYRAMEGSTTIKAVPVGKLADLVVRYGAVNRLVAKDVIEAWVDSQKS